MTDIIPSGEILTFEQFINEEDVFEVICKRCMLHMTPFTMGEHALKVHMRSSFHVVAPASNIIKSAFPEVSIDGHDLSEWTDEQLNYNRAPIHPDLAWWMVPGSSAERAARVREFEEKSTHVTQSLMDSNLSIYVDESYESPEIKNCRILPEDEIDTFTASPGTWQQDAQKNPTRQRFHQGIPVDTVDAYGCCRQAVSLGHALSCKG